MKLAFYLLSSFCGALVVKLEYLFTYLSLTFCANFYQVGTKKNLDLTDEQFTSKIPRRSFT